MTTANVTDRSNAHAELRESHGEVSAPSTSSTADEARPDRSVATWAAPVASAVTDSDGRLTPGRPSPGTATRPFRPHDPLLTKAQGRPVAFDLETRGSDRLWTDEPGTHVRLASFVVGTDHPRVTTSGPALRVGPDHTLLDILRVAGWLTGHGIINYDLPVLHVHHQAPTPWQLLEQGIDLHDTQLAENLIDPPEARMKEGEAQKHYKLENVAQRRGFPVGKTLDLAKVAKHYDGFEHIPWEDPSRNADLLEYARQDAALVRELFRRQFPERNPYMTREHRVAAIAAQMTMNGFAVDEVLLVRRIKEGLLKRAQIIAELKDRYGMPTEDKGGRIYKSPQATKAGKEAILAAFVDAGLNPDTFPRTEKTGSPDLSKDTMMKIIEHGRNERAMELAEAILDLNGIRTTYQQVADNLVNGRVHPNISMRQASGRWSFSKPGLTVMGKRQGRVTEREVFIADPGHVILSADLSQVDARAVAAFSQDENYMDLFAEGRDLWDEMAARFDIDRDKVKVLGHGANYSMGVNGAARNNPTIPRSEIERFYKEREEQFPRLMEWQAEVREQGESGDLLDNGFGRKLRVDPQRAYTQAPALSGQSAARDIMMQGVLNLCADHPQVLPWLRALVHDEVVLSVPQDIAQDVKVAAEQALAFPWAPPGAKRPIMIQAEATVGGRTWASAYGK
jgi:DNA polymerase I